MLNLSQNNKYSLNSGHDCVPSTFCPKFNLLIKTDDIYILGPGCNELSIQDYYRSNAEIFTNIQI